MLATLTGLGSGALHALSGPDHLVSLTPLSVGRTRGWIIGLLWGAGHGLGTLLLGGFLLLAAHELPLASVATWAERIAGVALLGLGLQGLRASLRGLGAAAAGVPQAGAGRLAWRAITTIGLIHGATGAAGLLLLLPAAVTGTPAEQALFLAGFTVGSTVAMAALTEGLASASRRPAASRLVRHAPPVASVASIALGVAWIALA